VHEKGTDHLEGINGPVEAEGEGNRDGNRQECRMWATVPGEVIMVVDEAIMEEAGEADTEGNKVEEVDMEGRTEEMDHKVKVDGNHVGGMMDLHHLVDLDRGVHQGGNERYHLPDVDHLVHHLDVENHPHPDDGTIHPQLDDETILHEGDVLTTRHLDEPLLREDVGTTIRRLGELGTIRPQAGGNVTIPPHLEKPKRMIHPQEDVETIRHLVELLGETHPDPDRGRDHLPSPHLVDAEGVRAEVGVERGRLHLKSGGGGVLPHLRLVLILRMPRWIRRMVMGTAMLR
jgi:hypothetical protein